MRTINTALIALCASLTACTSNPGGIDTASDASPAASDDGTDGAAPKGDAATATTPDASPDTHVINCQNVNGTQVTVIGNIRTAINDDMPQGPLPGAPAAVAFGADYGATGWPANLTSASTALPHCTVSVTGSTWTCTGSFSFGDAVQGFNLYVYDAAGDLRYFRLSSYDVTGYCTKSPKDAWGNQTKICSCETLPCDLAHVTDPSHCLP